MYVYCIMLIYIVFIADYQSKLEIIRSKWHALYVTFVTFENKQNFRRE